MKTLIGGAVATALGIICLASGCWDDLLKLMAGCVPIMLILCGCLAVYLGFDEMKDS